MSVENKEGMHDENVPDVMSDLLDMVSSKNRSPENNKYSTLKLAAIARPTANLKTEPEVARKIMRQRTGGLAKNLDPIAPPHNSGVTVAAAVVAVKDMDSPRQPRQSPRLRVDKTSFNQSPRITLTSRFNAGDPTKMKPGAGLTLDMGLMGGGGYGRMRRSTEPPKKKTVAGLSLDAMGGGGYGRQKPVHRKSPSLDAAQKNPGTGLSLDMDLMGGGGFGRQKTVQRISPGLSPDSNKKKPGAGLSLDMKLMGGGGFGRQKPASKSVSKSKHDIDPSKDDDGYISDDEISTHIKLGKVGSSSMSSESPLDIESSQSFSESGNRPPLSGKVPGKKHKKKKKKRKRRRRSKFQSTLEAPQEDVAMTSEQLKVSPERTNTLLKEHIDNLNRAPGVGSSFGANLKLDIQPGFGSARQKTPPLSLSTSGSSETPRKDVGGGGDVSNIFGSTIDFNATAAPEDLSKNMGSTINVTHSFFSDSDEDEKEDAETSKQTSVRFTESGTFEASSLAINEAGIVSNRGHVRTSDSGNSIARNRQVADFILLKELGRGAGGTVYMAVHAPTLRVVAIKKVKVVKDEKKRQIYREVQALYSNLVPLENAHSMQAPCPYLLTFHGAFTHAESTSINIVLEYMDGGELQAIVDRNERCSEDLLAQISFRILKGLKFLHSRREIHRDVKPHNVLLKKDGEVKISDLGILKELDKNVSLANTWAGTMVYMSPERLEGKPYSYSSDIWSFGLTVFTLATAKLPLENIGGFWAILELFRQDKIPSLPEEDFSEDLRDFVSNCLLKDPAQRLTASQLLHHPFITKHVQTAAIENGDMHSTLIQQAVKSPVGKSSSVSSSNQDDDHTPTLSSSMPMRVPPQMMATIPERRRTKSRQNIVQAGTKIDFFGSSVAPPSSLDPIDHSSMGVLQPQQKPLRPGSVLSMSLPSGKTIERRMSANLGREVKVRSSLMHAWESQSDAGTETPAEKKTKSDMMQFERFIVVVRKIAEHFKQNNRLAPDKSKITALAKQLGVDPHRAHTCFQEHFSSNKTLRLPPMTLTTVLITNRDEFKL